MKRKKKRGNGPLPNPDQAMETGLCRVVGGALGWRGDRGWREPLDAAGGMPRHSPGAGDFLNRGPTGAPPTRGGPQGLLLEACLGQE